jgi:predicted small lipoprotein YifL
MMRRVATALLFACSLVAGCGIRAPLEPPAGTSLPVAPYGRDEPPKAEGLLEAPTQALPERSVELRRRSEERENDAFDLPPPE